VKDIFMLVALSAVYLFLGAMEGHIWAGAAMAAATVAVVLLVKLWKSFWAKHLTLKKVCKTIFCVLGAILVVFLILAGVPIIPTAISLAIIVLLIRFMFNSMPEMLRKDKQKTQEFLDDFHDEMQQDVADYRRRKKLEDEKRRAARAEAEHLEDLARLWERNAQKYHTAKDIQKAREYREQANAAWRKIRYRAVYYDTIPPHPGNAMAWRTASCVCLVRARQACRALQRY